MENKHHPVYYLKVHYAKSNDKHEGSIFERNQWRFENIQQINNRDFVIHKVEDFQKIKNIYPFCGISLLQIRNFFYAK